MNLIMTPNLHGLTLFMWIASFLTLSISNEVKTDGTTSLMFASNASLVDTSTKKDDQVLYSVIQPKSESINSANLNKNVTPSIAGEGGPISIASTIQTVSSVAFHLTTVPENLASENNLPKEKHNAPKEASQVSPNVSKENVSLSEIRSSEVTKPVVEIFTTNTLQASKEHVNSNINNLKANVTDEHINNASNISVNSNSEHINTPPKNLSTTTTATTYLIKEHKAKPTVTIAGPNSDKEIPSSLIKGAHLGMSKKIDYVLPVIITLIALPVLGAIIFMVYKQGRDCWDKRHYRRMDFLIDGMYND